MNDVQKDLLEGLNDEQKQAVSHKEGPLMIVAGAGTGKTMVITRRIAWLIQQGLAAPENILALTFTDKAAGEMEERVDMLLPYGYVDLQISTFHSFCEKLLRDYGAEMGLSRDFQLLSELDTWLLMRKNLERFELDYYRPLGNPTKYIRSLMTHFSRAKDNAITPEAYLAYAEGKMADLDSANADEEMTVEVKRLNELANAYHTYQRILQENDCMDFGDLMLYVLQLFHKRPNVLKKIRERFAYVLVDEFQDTNFAQYELVKLIAAPKNNITIVGDDDQAIYKFRGASLANILEFENDFPEAKKTVLIKNYRSGQCILDHAYQSIQQNNPNRLEAREGGGLCKRLESACEHQGHIEHIHCSTLEDEVEAVVKRIVALQEKEKASWGDFAILVRSNDSATPFIQVFERLGIPFQFLALRGLYKKPIVLDILALLRSVNDPYDNMSFFRMLSHTILDVHTNLLAQISQEAKRQGKPLAEITKEIRLLPGIEAEQADAIEAFMNRLESLREIARTKPASEILLHAIKDTGFMEHLARLTEREKQESSNYLQQFYERMRGFEARHDHAILKHFLDEFDHELRAGEDGSLAFDPEAGPDVVSLMTIHASKGLEFPYVFVVNLVDRRFPTSAKRDAIPLPQELVKEQLPEGDWHLEEERRLFYVAMTRAKTGLYFTSADDYGGARKKKISRFLHELGYESIINGTGGIKDFPKEPTPKTKRNEELVLHLPKQFSFTQLAAYKTCPLQYKFAHLFRIPMMGKWTYSYGKTMHNTLQEFFEKWIERSQVSQGTLFGDGEQGEEKEKLPLTSEELLELYKEHWKDEWYRDDVQREEYRQKGKKSLMSYYALMKEERPKPLYLEQDFTLKIGDITLKGRIDRIDECEDGIEIIDYKTGSPKTAKQITKDQKEQLYLYQLAARDVLGLKPVKLTYHYLEDHSTVSFLGTDKQLLDFEESIVKRVKDMRDGKFEATPGFHCRFCDFADICEYRQ